MTQRQLKEYQAVNEERHRDHDGRHRDHDADISGLRRAEKNNRKCELFRSDLTGDEERAGLSACHQFRFVSNYGSSAWGKPRISLEVAGIKKWTVVSR